MRAALKAEYRYESSRRGSQAGIIVWFTAALLVDPDWTPDEPVPAWVICRDPRCLDGWTARPAAVPPPALHVEEQRQVVAVAEERHGLRSAPSAPRPSCVASPEAALAAQFDAFRFAVVFWNAAWLCGWLGFGAWRLVRSAAPPPPGHAVS